MEAIEKVMEKVNDDTYSDEFRGSCNPIIVKFENSESARTRS